MGSGHHDQAEFDPGPDYRLATRGERIIDGLRGIGDALVAVGGGALAATLTFVLVALMPMAIMAHVSELVSSAGEAGQPATGFPDLSAVLHLGWVIIGLVVGIFAGVRVTIAIARTQPLRGSPVRPVA
ncbi:hypothetical protein [[Mycobacterium] zoologicum]|uniref:hypothetical protein n=1 Tax=[Mycobacterium] zoologicum TaxID=2872311 RepID=UPI002C948308|nr:hypothetical protein [Mycolicibacter sp. MYC101]MEB3065067.1 hypothetical protein [Mycolicibacter sp. MYC101]